MTRGFIGLDDEQLIQTTAPYNSAIERKLTYDGVARLRREMREPMGDGRLFGYDALGRLVADSMITGDGFPPCTTTGPDPNDEGAQCNHNFWQYWAVSWVDSFAYDSAGNRTDHGGSYGPGNRIQAFDGCSYSTDNDGNVTQRSCSGETVTIAWNGDNRPNRFTVNGKTIDLYYDPSGRLVRRDTSGVAQAYFLWDGDNLFAELDAAGEKRAEYSYYPGQDNLHAVIKGSTPYYAHTDGLGNVVAVTNPSQQLAWTYEYDVWGQPTDGGGVDTLNNRARYKGALWLGPEAEFYYMRNRWYEPKTGRFLSEDPIGLEGGINLYAFAGNDPVNGRDPMGLDGCTLWAWVERNPRGEIERIIGDPWWGDSENPYKPCAEDEAGRPGGWQPPAQDPPACTAEFIVAAANVGLDGLLVTGVWSGASILFRGGVRLIATRIATVELRQAARVAATVSARQAEARLLQAQGGLALMELGVGVGVETSLAASVLEQFAKTSALPIKGSKEAIEAFTACRAR